MIESKGILSTEEMFGFTEKEMDFIGSEVAATLGGSPLRATNVVKFAMFMALKNREHGEGEK